MLFLIYYFLNTETHTLNEPDPSRLPFDLFDESIPLDKVYSVIHARIQNLPKPGSFNVYNPQEEFEKVFKQAVDTTDGLKGIIDAVRKELRLNDGLTATRTRFLQRIHQVLDDFKVQNPGDTITDEKLQEKFPYLKCANIVDHVLGTTGSLLSDPFKKKDIYSIRDFTRYFIKALIIKYVGAYEEAKELIDYFSEKTFNYIVHVNIVDYLPKEGEDDETLTPAKCIDLFVNEKLKGINIIWHDQQDIPLLSSEGLLDDHLPHNSIEYRTQLIVQTIVWNLISSSKIQKLLRFKTIPFTLMGLLECYIETLVEFQNIFDDVQEG